MQFILKWLMMSTFLFYPYLPPANFISWTSTGGNRLKECELVTRGCDLNFTLEGYNFAYNGIKRWTYMPAPCPWSHFFYADLELTLAVIQCMIYSLSRSLFLALQSYCTWKRPGIDWFLLRSNRGKHSCREAQRRMFVQMHAKFITCEDAKACISTSKNSPAP